MLSQQCSCKRFLSYKDCRQTVSVEALIPTLRILGKTLIKRYGFYCNILLICLFAFQDQCLAVFRSITFAGLQQIVTLLNNLQTVVPHSHHFIGCMEKHGSRHLVYRRFVTQCDNLAIGSPTATVEPDNRNRTPYPP